MNNILIKYKYQDNKMKCCCFCNKDYSNFSINSIQSSNSHRIIPPKNKSINLFNIIPKNNEVQNVLSFRPTSINENKEKDISQKSIESPNLEKKEKKKNPSYPSNNIIKNKTQPPIENLKFCYFDEEKKEENKNIKNVNNIVKTRSNLQIPKIKIPKIEGFEKLNKNKLKIENINEKKKKVKKKTRFNLIANTNIENNNIKLSKVNVEKHRLSIINLDSLVKEQFNKKKSISAINIRNKESNEVKIIKSISKSNHISTREDLIYLTILKNTKKLDKFTLYQESHNLNYLLLENYSGKLLLKNLIIEPLGLIKYSRRNAKDTLTFFGYSEYKDYNDYVLNNTSFIYDNKLFTKTFLAISYDINYNIYFIQPILDKKKQGKFVLIDISNSDFSFINNKVFMINEVILLIIPSKERNHQNINYYLNITIIESENDHGRNCTINILKHGKPIKIGYKDDDYLILTKEKNINQDCYCEIFFDKDKEIYSISGKGFWYVLDQKYSIKKETLVKIGDDIIRIKNCLKSDIFNYESDNNCE